jgi:hypothetical protein
MKRQIESYKEAQDSNIKTIRSLEENISKLNIEKAENVKEFPKNFHQLIIFPNLRMKNTN